MSIEENKALIRSYYEEFFIRRNFRIVDDFFPPDYVHHLPELPEYRMDFQDFRKRELNIARAFPDGRREIEDQIAEGDKVVTRFIFRGTQMVDMPEKPATDKKVNVHSIIINRLKDGKIVEGWETYDSLGMMEQLELVNRVSTLSRAPQERGYFDIDINPQW